MMESGFLSIAINIGFFFVMGGILLGFVRLAKGPSLADRVVALDMMTVSIVAFCALFAISAGTPVFLDVAIALALIGFLATVALARYAERRMVQRGATMTKTDGPESEDAETEEDARPGESP